MVGGCEHDRAGLQLTAVPLQGTDAPTSGGPVELLHEKPALIVLRHHTRVGPEVVRWRRMPRQWRARRAPLEGSVACRHRLDAARGQARDTPLTIGHCGPRHPTGERPLGCARGGPSSDRFRRTTVTARQDGYHSRHRHLDEWTGGAQGDIDRGRDAASDIRHPGGEHPVPGTKLDLHRGATRYCIHHIGGVHECGPRSISEHPPIVSALVAAPACRIVADQHVRAGLDHGHASVAPL